MMISIEFFVYALYWIYACAFMGYIIGGFINWIRQN
jgi:hypothetical protein